MCIRNRNATIAIKTYTLNINTTRHYWSTKLLQLHTTTFFKLSNKKERLFGLKIDLKRLNDRSTSTEVIGAYLNTPISVGSSLAIQSSPFNCTVFPDKISAIICICFQPGFFSKTSMNLFFILCPFSPCASSSFLIALFTTAILSISGIFCVSNVFIYLLEIRHWNASMTNCVSKSGSLLKFWLFLLQRNQKVTSTKHLGFD